MTVVVRAQTKTSTRDEVVDEALEHEGVEVKCVPIECVLEAILSVGQEGDTTVFPVAEEIVVERRVVLKEEIRVTRRRTIERHVETVALRSQEAIVTRTEIEAKSVAVAMADKNPSTIPSNPVPHR